MGLAVIAAAYSRPSLAHRVLRGNDLSYGLYTYHMPIVGLLIQIGCMGSLVWVGVALGSALTCAVMSWRFVERPFLRRKRVGLRVAQVTPNNLAQRATE
jgi:peptidoglycan/LPS O-acetylase OafA/YrhL